LRAGARFRYDNEEKTGLTMSKWLVSVSIAMMLAAGGVQAAGDVEAGKAKSAVCMACHGPDGNSPNPIWPKLAGQHPSYIKKQLHDFKGGARTDPLMAPMAAPLSEGEMDDLAAYFSSQTQTVGVAAADKVALGEKIFRAGNVTTGVAACMGCHGPSGMGVPEANYPRISGQHGAYLEKSLKDFRAGTRSNDANKMMQDIAGKMTDEEIAAVASYIQGLH
jgi:cytochrome c553